MRKKSLTWMLAALMGVFATACSNDDDVAGADGNSTNTVTFRVTPDEGTQTRADATDPEIPTGKVLRYIMEVYDKTTGTIVADSRQVKTTTDPATAVEFTMEKKTEGDYNVLFWADYTTDETDLYYNTVTGGLKAVTFNNATPTDLDGEAFYGSTTIGFDGIPVATSIILKHAVAQVNIKTTTQLKGSKSVKVTYGDAENANAPMSSFDATDGSVKTALTIANVVNKVDNTKVPVEGTPEAFHTFYVFAPKDTKGIINMEIALCSDESGATVTKTTNVPNVPLKANYRTNIIGDFNEVMTIFSVSCDATWETPDLDISVWNGTIPAANADYTFKGEGTDVKPYEISSAVDLAQLAANINSGTTYTNKYFKLTRDIDLDNHPWTPIGKTSFYPFQITFDGNNKQITNLNVQTDGYAGLFGGGKSSYKVTKLHVSGTVTSTATSSSSAFAGGIIAYGENTDAGDAKIQECSFNGSVTCSRGYAGGIAGRIQATNIDRCKNAGTVSGANTGGIVGQMISNACAVSDCYNIGEVIGTTNCAGIVGASLTTGGTKHTINYCYNIGTITTSGTGPYSDGAIVAKVSSGSVTVNGCYYKTAYRISNEGETEFGASAWPAYPAWSNQTWSYGSWNDGPTYPKLLWEFAIQK